MLKKLTLAAGLLLGMSVAACRDASVQRADGDGRAFSPTSPSVKSGDVTGEIENVVAPVPPPQEFLNAVAVSDAFEIQASRLALERGTSSQVKAFAARMVQDHTASTARLRAAAGTLAANMPAEPALSAEQRQVLAQLRSKRGADFDNAYASTQEDAHDRTLTLLKNYAEKGDASGLNQFAYASIPIVSGHLTMLRNLMRQATSIRPD